MNIFVVTMDVYSALGTDTHKENIMVTSDFDKAYIKFEELSNNAGWGQRSTLQVWRDGKRIKTYGELEDKAIISHDLICLLELQSKE